MRANDTKSQVGETQTILKKEKKSPAELEYGNESTFALALFFVAALIKAFKWQSNRGL